MWENFLSLIGQGAFNLSVPASRELLFQCDLDDLLLSSLLRGQRSDVLGEPARQAVFEVKVTEGREMGLSPAGPLNPVSVQSPVHLVSLWDGLWVLLTSSWFKCVHVAIMLLASVSPSCLYVGKEGFIESPLDPGADYLHPQHHQKWVALGWTPLNRGRPSLGR